MATVKFGDVSADMRLENQFYGITDLQSFATFVSGLDPVSIVILNQTATQVVARMFDASSNYATFTLKGDIPSLQINEIYVAAQGVRLVIKGDFVVDPSTYDISGTATSVAAIYAATGELIVRFGEIDLSFSSLSDILAIDAYGATLLSGADNVAGGGGADYLLGYAGGDRLVGNDGNDTLSGNLGDDTLNGNAGTDELRGGNGNDTYVLDTAGDTIVELAAQGDDLVRSSVSHTLAAQVERLTLVTGAGPIDGTGNGRNNTLSGNEAANVLSGLDGNDSLLGYAANDELAGGSGADSLVGHAGNDKLAGGLGNDALAGGTGLDTFRFDTAPNATSNRDTIDFFSVPDDTIQLENLVFGALANGTLATAAFHKGPGVVAAHDASDRIIYDTTDGALYYDPDGTGPSLKVKFALLANSPDGLTEADFFVT